MIVFTLRTVAIVALVGWVYFNRKSLWTFLSDEISQWFVNGSKGFANWFTGLATFGRWYPFDGCGYECGSYFLGGVIAATVTVIVAAILLVSFLV